MSDEFKDVWEELVSLSKQEQLLETVDPVNQKFIENSLRPHKFKVYDSQHLPYEISDKYLGGRLKDE